MRLPSLRRVGRRLARVVVLSALPCLVLAASAGAQVPTTDVDVDVGFGGNFVARLGEWYAIASRWRNTLLDRARAMVTATQTAIGIRERLEQKAVGELGVLGNEIPDWRHLAQFCTVDGSGGTTCVSSRSLTALYERVLPSTLFRQYSQPLFASVGAVDSIVNRLLAGQHAPGVTLVDSYRGTLHESTGGEEPFAVELGQRGAAVSATAQAVQATVDTLVQAQVNGQQLSSGRARQLTATATRAELLLETDLARAAATALQVNTMGTASQVSRYRAAEYGGGPLFAW